MVVFISARLFLLFCDFHTVTSHATISENFKNCMRITLALVFEIDFGAGDLWGRMDERAHLPQPDILVQFLQFYHI